MTTSPFDKNYKSGIDLKDLNNNNRRSMSLTKHVEKKRKVNPTFGTLYGIGELVIDPSPYKRKEKK